MDDTPICAMDENLAVSKDQSPTLSPFLIRLVAHRGAPPSDGNLKRKYSHSSAENDIVQLIATILSFAARFPGGWNHPTVRPPWHRV